MNEDHKFASRKSAMSMLVAIAALVLLVLVLEFIKPEVWADVTKWIVGLYMAGNVGASVADGIKAVFGTKQ